MQAVDVGSIAQYFGYLFDAILVTIEYIYFGSRFDSSD